MKVGSLFSGIGGMELGLERAGMEVVWQVEIDDYCQRVLAKHWPNVRRYEDVKEVGQHNLEPVDLICGGFPCQDISNAGKRAGIDGKRSGLWTEYFRIVCELRPRVVLVENVAALLGRGLDRVLGDLASCGYDAEWDCIPAAAVGAPHRRDRVFIIATQANALGSNAHGARSHFSQADDGEQGGKVQPRHKQGSVFGSVGEDVADASKAGWGHKRVCGNMGGSTHSQKEAGDKSTQAIDYCREDVGNTDCSRRHYGRDQKQQKHTQVERGISSPSNVLADAESVHAQRLDNRSRQVEPWRSGWWATEPDVGRVVDGVSEVVDGTGRVSSQPTPKGQTAGRIHRLKGLGNAVVPQVAEWIGRRIMEAELAGRYLR